MKVIIIEDEIKTAKALGKMIVAVEPTAEIVATLQSVKEAVHYFASRPAADLIFMDVQLSDGICFEIFEAVEILCPVIFCTAFNEYALEGFQTNGIDYILKPFTQETLKKSFAKVHRLKMAFLQEPQAAAVQNAMMLHEKECFLVFSRNRYITIPARHIAYFFIKNDLPAIFTFTEEIYFVNQTLKEIASQVSPKQFYRISRQYILNFEAIKNVEHYFSRKLQIHLNVPATEKLLLNKNNTAEFMKWMEAR